MSDGKPTSFAELAQALDDLPVILRAARRMRGLSLRAAAAEIGVATSTMNRIEDGHQYHTDGLRAVLRWLDDAGRNVPEPQIALDSTSTVEELMTQLRKIREQRRISQSDMAARLGVTSATVCRWESGQRSIDTDDLARYAFELGFEVQLEAVKREPVESGGAV